MARTKVKRDAHGLYVRTDGKLYRPVKTIDGYPLGRAASLRDDGTSAFKEGSQVQARHLSGTPFCLVKDESGVQEHWHSHGMYLGVKSTDCWSPLP
jgi:hypothetical protein